MPSLAASIKESLCEFCGSTSAHGFAYLVRSRNRAEVFFWRIVLLISLVWSLYLTVQSVLFWAKQPVDHVIESVNYNTGKVEAPSIAFCPKQYLDELHLLSIELNTIRFRCRDNEYASYAQLDFCNASHVSSLREPSSPFFEFLEELKAMVNSASKGVGGEIDWRKQPWWHLPVTGREEDFFVFTDKSFQFSFRAFPVREEMPRDEDLFTLKYFPLLLQRVADDIANLPVPIAEPYMTSEQRFQFNHMAVWYREKGINLLKGSSSNILQENPEIASFREYLEHVDRDFQRIGVLRGTPGEFSAWPSETNDNNTGIPHEYDLWIGITRKYYFMDKLANVGLGSLFRQYLPNMLFQDNALLPLQSSVNSSTAEIILYKLYNFTNSLRKLSNSLQWLHDLEEKSSFRSYFKDMTRAAEERFLFNKRTALEYLSALKYALVSHPVPKEQSSAAVSKKWGFKQHGDVVNASRVEKGSYTVEHYLNSLNMMDVDMFLKLEDFRDEISSPATGSGALIQPEPYQVGHQLNGLDLIPYCSKEAGCEENMKQIITPQGLCSVWNGRSTGQDMSQNDMIALLDKAFALPKVGAKEEPIRFSDVISMTFLLDVHNNEIKKSLNRPGSVLLSIGERNSLPYIIDHHILHPGLTTAMVISPTVQTADPDLHSIAPDIRECFFPTENPHDKSMFRSYSRHSCIYECAIKKAIEQRNNSCIPWDIPYSFRSGQTWICNGPEAARFKDRMYSSYAQCGVSCMDDCSSTKFSTLIESSLTRPDFACRNEEFFHALQNDEAENEFACAESVRNGYLIGKSIKERFCHNKMENDVVILKLVFKSTNVIKGNLQKAMSTLDFVGLFGGMLGLFAGCSILISVELTHLLMTIFSSALKWNCCSQRLEIRNYIYQIMCLYFGSTSLHGMGYIKDTGSLPGRVAWTILVVTSLTVGLELSRSAYLGFSEEMVLRVLDHEKIPVTKTQYPAITICPQQYNDRWNLARALMNTLPLRDPASKEIDPDVYSTFEDFFASLLSQDWINEDEVTEESWVKTPITNRLLEAFSLTTDTISLGEHIAEHVLRGKVPSLRGSKHTAEQQTWYEVDLGKAAQWTGIAVQGEVDSVLALAGANESLAFEESSLQCGSFHIENGKNVFDVETQTSDTCYYEILCFDAIVSRYVRLSLTGGNTHLVGPVLFPVENVANERMGYCFENKEKFDAAEEQKYQMKCSCLSTEYEYPSMKMCDNVFGMCEEGIKLLWQIPLWEDLALDKVGTMVSLFAETVIRGTFYLDIYVQNENTLIQYPSESEVSLYTVLANILSTILNASSSNIALTEVPILLNDLSQFHDTMTPTRREKAANKIYYAFLKLWQEEHMPANSSYSVKVDFESYANDPDALNSDYLFDLSHDLGLDTIARAYENHYFSHEFAPHLTEIMTIMRFSQVQANLYWPPAKIQSALKDHWPIAEDSNTGGFAYVQLRSGEVESTKNKLQEDLVDPAFLIDYSWNRLEMLPLCQFATVYPDTFSCRSGFHHIVTDQGICSAFNTLSIKSQYKPNEYLDTFMSLYNTASVDSPISANGYGSYYRMSLVLDIHRTDVFGSQAGYFKIAINNALDPFSTLHGISVFPAQETNVLIKTLLVASEESSIKQDVELEKRRCRFRDEMPNSDSIFLNYTQKRCQYECQLRAAKGSMTCNPWNHFHFDDELKRPVCTRNQVAEFQAQITQAALPCLSSCLENCEDVIYEYGTDRRVIDPDSTCKDTHLLMLAQLGISDKHDLFYWKYWRRSQWHLNSMGHNLPTDEASRCMEKVEKDYAFVTFVLVKSHADVLTISKKYDYEMQLSIIGGTLSLWTGFSIISLIELAYWIFITLSDKLYEKLNLNTLIS